MPIYDTKPLLRRVGCISQALFINCSSTFFRPAFLFWPYQVVEKLLNTLRKSGEILFRNEGWLKTFAEYCCYLCLAINKACRLQCEHWKFEQNDNYVQDE